MPALSMNHSHQYVQIRGRPKRIKTNDTRLYEREFSRHLLNYTEEISEFLKDFDPENMAVSADYEFYFPKETYYTKKGRLNLKKLPDTDNLIKITQDLIFSQLVNDSHIIELSARKLPTLKEAFIKVSLETIDLPQEIENSLC